ncbi:MAG: methyltransferase domain-containing protein [Chitinophagaceae bacterium]
MPVFQERSGKKELLDEPGVPFEDIRRNMLELDIINQRLGGHAVTLAGLAFLVKNSTSNRPLHIVEIGCGGGDNLRVIHTWCKRKGLSVHLTGVDINPECIFFARSMEQNKGISFICLPYQEAIFTEPPSIIFSSLFCHHFSDEQLIFMIDWMEKKSSVGFFINDLHRHPLAFYSISMLTRIFSKSRLVRNDAPLSVLRSFVRQDWVGLLANAGIESYSLQWKWAFRWLIIHIKK